MVPLATWLIAAYSWRTAITVFAALPILLLAPAIYWVVVNRPEDRGLVPDGGSEIAPPDSAEQSDEIDPPKGPEHWTLRRAIRDARPALRDRGLRPLRDLLARVCRVPWRLCGFRSDVDDSANLGSKGTGRSRDLGLGGGPPIEQAPARAR